METILYDILIQVACYMGVMLFMLFAVAALQRGFFFKYVKVRTSFGRLLMVKIRTILRDYYEYGWVDEGFLIYKHNKETIRIAINANDKIIYRALSVNWVDVDEEKNAVSKTDYTAIAGFDSKKFSDLLTRALMRPALSSGQEKIILICCILGVVIGLACVYLSYQNYAMLQQLPNTLTSSVTSAISSTKGTVISAASTI